MLAGSSVDGRGVSKVGCVCRTYCFERSLEAFAGHSPLSFDMSTHETLRSSGSCCSEGAAEGIGVGLNKLGLIWNKHNNVQERRNTPAKSCRGC